MRTSLLWLCVGLAFFLGAAAAKSRIPFLRSDDTNYVLFKEGASLVGGRRDVWPGAPDFLLRMTKDDAVFPLNGDGSPKFYARSGMFSDIGDAPDLALRRAGPDNADPTAKPASLAPRTTIGTLYWQAWGGRCAQSKEAFGFFAGCGNNGRNAAIFARAESKQTGYSRAGSLHFATTPKGNPGEPVDRLEIASDGSVTVDPSLESVTLRIKRPSRDSETALVTSFQANGHIQVRRVEIGGRNTCGTGYRCLRIRN